ncbi:MAG: hypothetical protein AAFN07_03365 [Pseudomonadota bacterium]
MKAAAIALCLATGLLSQTADAEISNRDIPPDALWYINIDMEALRTSEPGEIILDWVDEEVTDDLERDLNFNAGEDLDRLFFHGNAEGSFSARILGDLSEDTRDHLRSEMLKNTDATLKNDGWGEYYVIEDAGDEIEFDNGDMSLDTDTIYVSLADNDGLFIASSAERLAAEIRGIRGGNANVLVLDGRRPFLQIGVNADEIDKSSEFGFDSDLLRQTSQVALMIGSVGDALDFHTKITATDPEVTDSMANIVRGLISLRMLSSEVPEPVGRIIDKLRVDSDSSGMSIRLQVTPDEVRELSDL